MLIPDLTKDLFKFSLHLLYLLFLINESYIIAYYGLIFLFSFIFYYGFVLTSVLAMFSYIIITSGVCESICSYLIDFSKEVGCYSILINITNNIIGIYLIIRISLSNILPRIRYFLMKILKFCLGWILYFNSILSNNYFSEIMINRIYSVISLLMNKLILPHFMKIMFNSVKGSLEEFNDFENFYEETIDMDKIDDLDDLEDLGESQIIETKPEESKQLTTKEKKNNLKKKRLQQRNNRAVGANQRNMANLNNLMNGTGQPDAAQLQNTLESMLSSMSGGNLGKMMNSIPKKAFSDKNMNQMMKQFSNMKKI